MDGFSPWGWMSLLWQPFVGTDCITRAVFLHLWDGTADLSNTPPRWMSSSGGQFLARSQHSAQKQIKWCSASFDSARFEAVYLNMSPFWIDMYRIILCFFVGTKRMGPIFQNLRNTNTQLEFWGRKHTGFQTFRSLHQATIMNIGHIWEPRSQKNSMEEPNLRFVHEHIWHVICLAVRSPCFSTLISGGAKS